jgi:hypothetical protein
MFRICKVSGSNLNQVTLYTDCFWLTALIVRWLRSTHILLPPTETERWRRPSDSLSLSSKKFRLNLCQTFVSHVNVSYIWIREMRQYLKHDVVVQRDGTNLRAWYLSSRVLYMDGHSEAGSALRFSIYRSLPYMLFYFWISYFSLHQPWKSQILDERPIYDFWNVF